MPGVATEMEASRDAGGALQSVVGPGAVVDDERMHAASTASGIRRIVEEDMTLL